MVFRHGDRTPDQEEMALYPDNPHINEKFEPFGLKALTNKGKNREYKIGVFLREYYKHYLSKLYIPSEIYVRTTDYDRTKMSALACLAGLYEPQEEQMWHPNIRWQPIPYHTVDYDRDDMMYYYTCPRFLEARTEHLHSAEFQEKLAPYNHTFGNVSYHTGRDLTVPEDIFYIDNLFQAQENYGLDMPDWAKTLMPDIKKMTVMEYSLQFATDELKRIGGGQLLYKMLQDAKNKIDGTLQPANRKIFIYSGHENNVAAILACSGVFQPHQPPYGATFILELHKMVASGEHAFRVVYLKDATQDPEYLTVPGCEEFCEYSKFLELTKNTVTENVKAICDLKNP